MNKLFLTIVLQLLKSFADGHVFTFADLLSTSLGENNALYGECVLM